MKKLITILSIISLVIIFQAIGVADEGYLLGVGDILSINILASGKPQQSLDLPISSRGTINFPYIGETKAAGLQVSELIDEVTGLLAKDYFHNPQVIITIKEYKSRQALITGAVNNPGTYSLEGATTLLEVITKAGGLTNERGDWVHIIKGSIKVAKESNIVELIEKKESVKINLTEMLENTTPENNILINSGDVVYVQPSQFSGLAQHKVYVLGKVNKPGAYDFRAGLTALDACVMAGGFSNYAAPNRTIVTRQKKDGTVSKIKIDLNKVKEGEMKGILLEPGDRIYVPKSWF